MPEMPDSTAEFISAMRDFTAVDERVSRLRCVSVKPMVSGSSSASTSVSRQSIVDITISAPIMVRALMTMFSGP